MEKVKTDEASYDEDFIKEFDDIENKIEEIKLQDFQLERIKELKSKFNKVFKFADSFECFLNKNFREYFKKN